MSANAKQQNKTFTSYIISYCLHASIETKLPLAEAAAFFSGVFADFLVVGLALVVVAFLALAAVLLRVVFAMMTLLSKRKSTLVINSCGRGVLNLCALTLHLFTPKRRVKISV